jgi:hypothetical protein
MPSTSPTCPRVISVTSRWTPPDRPRWTQTCPGLRRSPAPARPASPTRPPAPPTHTAAESTRRGQRPAGEWTGAHTPPPAAQGAGRPPCYLAAPTAAARSWPPSFTGQISEVHARLAHARQPHCHDPAGQHRQPPHRRPPVGLRQSRPALLGRPLWGQGLPPSSTTRPPHHAHGLAAARRPRPAAAAPHVRVSAFVLPDRHSWVQSAWQIEEAFQAGKGLCGLDQHQVRRWRSWYRWTTLAMVAYAFLVVAAVTQHARHPPPLGLIPLTCNEIQHLFAALVAAPVADTGHRLRWSWWRRRHQARARACHYRRQANGP